MNKLRYKEKQGVYWHTPDGEKHAKIIQTFFGTLTQPHRCAIKLDEEYNGKLHYIVNELSLSRKSHTTQEDEV